MNMKPITLYPTENPYWAIWEVYRMNGGYRGARVAVLHAIRRGDWGEMEHLAVTKAREIAPSRVFRNGEKVVEFGLAD
jgi:hypothetical protein